MIENISDDKWHECWKQGQIDSRKEELVNFYERYFTNEEDAEKFVIEIYNQTSVDNKICLRMMNNTMRLAKLAEDMEIIRPGKNALKITYLITCIETLYKISGKTTDKNGEKFNKVSIVIDFFEIYVSDEDKKYILSKVKRSIADSYFSQGESFDELITIEIFARIINEVRNVFMHTGEYWNLSLSNLGCPELKIMNVEEERGKGKSERIYEFELVYNELHQIFIRAFVNYINLYIDNNIKSQ